MYSFGGKKKRCIPYRFEKTVGRSNCNVEKKLLVLMISSPNRDDLVFPKVSIFLPALFVSYLKLYCDGILTTATLVHDQGGWENDETMHEAACREALEEAGVKGVLGVGFSSLLGNRHGLFVSVMFNSCYRNL